MGQGDDQHDVIAFLSDAENLGASGAVERIDTHAAMIFLTADRAYKLKRAVRYLYLDFLTPARRQAVCEAELALNRRTAPGLYCGVAMIGRKPDGQLALGHGTAVDWVVVMRRFPAECLFTVLADEHRLTPALIRELADRIAEFHASAASVYGSGAKRVRQVIEGNHASMAALPEGLLDDEGGNELARRSLAMLDELAPLLDRRAHGGHVRHCHGDLHLANICLWNGQPMLFDCLEFDPELATSDVLYDLAFLVMDLWQRGLHGEASLLFNRYCDRYDEGEGLATLPLFLSMRAAVRTHVEGSAAGQQCDPAKREARFCAARAYLAAAVGFLDMQRPRLIAIGGLSGSGKSTLAGRLAPHIGAAPGARWLRSDVLRKRIAGVAPEQRLPQTAYNRQASVAVYDKLLDESRLALTAGMTVIADAVFADPAERAAIARLGGKHGVPFTGLWLEAPGATLHQRVGNRRGDASDADGSVVDRQLGFVIGDLAGWQRLDASAIPEQILAVALRVIGI